ncbi:hypothetical protein T265_03704 [Opisthorchis viverrini]|uniref:Oxidoreductase, short chain dehydrogenase/reductase family protein n=1 Tax=Opisthorchis viverrini TaxID=6198 RepID=A0A074ZVB2_OPIVI|nr:hypothetical protein T265_03704 [Opisthorchis viverrini]KER29797.1 hypothetical protein T265_03704 [Opisthorchis viverrini]
MSDSKSQTNAAPEAAANDVYRGPETKGWWRELCCIPLRMDSRLAVVTGANSGIGLSVTGELARRGATVIMACRDISKAQSAKDSLLRMYGAENPESTKTDVVDETISSILSPIQDEQLRLEQLDLSSFESIRNFVERFIKTNEPLDYLINNAAIISRTYEKSVDGQELQLAVNYLGPVLLTELLLPSLKKSPKGRIVNMTDALHYLGNLHKPTLHLSGSSYGPYVAYNQSKLALTMYTVELARRLEGTSVIPVSVYPGPVNTAFQKSSNSTLELRLEQLDLSSFESIRNFVERFIKTNEPLDYLINNAAIISRTYEKSVDGQELQLAVNYLGPVLLTELLLPSLKKSPKGRIVNMTDALHYLGNLHKPTLHLSGSSYGPYVAYNQSKLALTMYTVELARRLEGTSVIPVSVYPGPVNTAFQKSSNSTLEKMYTALTMPQRISPWEAAQQVIHALLRRRLIPGGYYDRYDRGFPDRLALTQLERTWLWDKTKEILQLKE